MDSEGGPVTDDASNDELDDQLDALRERIRRRGLSSVERAQVDQLVLVVTVADSRADAAQLRVTLGQDPGRLDGEVPSHTSGRPWS